MARGGDRSVKPKPNCKGIHRNNLLGPFFRHAPNVEDFTSLKSVKSIGASPTKKNAAATSLQKIINPGFEASRLLGFDQEKNQKKQSPKKTKKQLKCNPKRNKKRICFKMNQKKE